MIVRPVRFQKLSSDISFCVDEGAFETNMKLIALLRLLLMIPVCSPSPHNIYKPRKVDTLNIGDFLTNFDLVQSEYGCPFRIVELTPYNPTLQLHKAYSKLFNHFTPIIIQQQNILHRKLKLIPDTTKKYLHQCETLVIPLGGYYQDIQRTVEAILHLDGRPTKDYYLFLGHEETLFNHMYTVLPPKILKFTLFVHLRLCNSSQNRSKGKFGNKNIFSKNDCEIVKMEMGIPQLRQKRINLNGLTLEMTCVHIPPLIMINKKTRRPFAGMMYKMYMSTGKQFNVTFNILGGLEGTGRILPNKTWTGMVGDLMYRRYDLAATMRVTPQRYGLIDVTEFMWQDPPVFITALPKGHISLAAIIHPFTPFVWFMVGLSFISIFPALFLSIVTTRLMRQMTLVRLGRITSAHLGRLSEHLYEAIMIPYGLSLDQGVTIPDGTWTLSCLWMLFVIIMSTGYKDKLFAFLTFPEPEVIPTNILQLHDRTDYRIVFHYWKSALFNLFNTSEHQVHKDLVKRFILEPNVVQCILLAVFEPKTVCIAFKSLASLTLASNTTLISEFEAAVFSDNILLMDPMYIGIGAQKDSFLTEDMSTISSMFRDTGFLGIWEDEAFRHFKMVGKNWLDSQVGSKIHNQISMMIYNFFTPVKPLVMANFYITFLILGVLSFLSLFLFAHEFKQSTTWERVLDRTKNSSHKTPIFDNGQRPYPRAETRVSLHADLHAIRSASNSKLNNVFTKFKTKVTKEFNHINTNMRHHHILKRQHVDKHAFHPFNEPTEAERNPKILPGYLDLTGQVHSLSNLL